MTTGTVLLIDNYDSFAHNLARYLRQLGQEVDVVRNDSISTSDVRRRNPIAIVLSPGPCHPDDAGCSIDVVQAFSGKLPILGVCLGHQAIVAAFGGRVIRAPAPVHGRASMIQHSKEGIFAGVPNPFRACRYHSLVADGPTLPSMLHITATEPGGLIMAIRHTNHPTFGFQFHPESILTDHGYLLLENFMRVADLPIHNRTPTIADELGDGVSRPSYSSRDPVTF